MGLTVLHYGGGTNSLGLLCGLLNRNLKPDLILFADTGGEKPETYASIQQVNNFLVNYSWPEITIVKYKTKDGVELTLEEDCRKRESLPSIAFGFKTCSQRWKVRPQDYFIRDWKPAQEAWARGERVEKLIGYDADEERRAKDFNDDKFDVSYPLIEWGWTREDCIKAILSYKFDPPGKSACFFCPSSKKAEVSALQKEHPDLYARAVDMEERAKPNVSVAGLGRRWAWADVPIRAELVKEESGQIELPCGCFDG